MATALASSLLLLGVPAVGAPAAAAAELPETVTADVLPTVQINGVVWAQVTVGNTVYVTGKFTSARPAGAAAGTNETPRGNLLAYDLTTGNLITSFSPSLNGEGLGITASPDGSRIYVVGNFTQVTAGGTTVTRNRIVALDAATGALVNSFVPSLNFRTRAVTVVGGTVYVGGKFSAANGTTRSGLAAFRASDGSLLPWAPTADDDVFALVAPEGERIVAAGRFTKLNGQDNYGMGALDPTSGANEPWAATSVIRNAGADAAIWSLATDGDQVYGTGYHFGSGGNLEGSFSADAGTGQLTWVAGCKGDTYSVAPIGDVVYTVGHPHGCEPIGGWPDVRPMTIQRAQAMTKAVGGTNQGGTFDGRPAPTLLNWWPQLTIGSFTGQSQAAWSVTGNSRYISVGGEFPKVNNVAQQGLVRFAIRSVAPKKAGPRSSSALTPDLAVTGPGTVRVRWRATWDYEDRDLQYRVVRNGATGSPVGTVTQSSTWWDQPLTGFEDTGLSAGATYSYRIYAYDRDGNSVASSTTSITVPATTVSPYSQRVRADGAVNYWPLGTATASGRAVDWAGVNDLVLDSSVSGSSQRAVVDDPGTASTFAGSGAVPAATQQQITAPTNFSLETWIRTSTTRGGKIIGFGNSNTEVSSSADRHVFMRNDGKLTFGVYPGAYKTVTSPQAYNDGEWHHVVASLSSAGLALYVDGTRVALDASVTTSRDVKGYWRVGGDRVQGWPSQPTSSSFAGDIDEVAVYPTALSPATVAAHFAAAGGQAPSNQDPSASFTATSQNLTVALDASGSTDPDGSISSYAWDFGNGTSGTGQNPSVTYAAAGTYTVRLTVTDDDGATASTTRSVTVTAGQQPSTLAQDAFGRTVSGGWGSASTGGAWTVSGGASNFSVGAGVGRILTGASGPAAILPGISSQDTDIRYTVSLDRLPTKGVLSLTTVGRRISSTSDYRGTIRVGVEGSLTLAAARRVSGAETALATATQVGITATPGTPLNVRMQVQGNGSTTVRMKVWPVGTSEPSEWQLQAQDGTGALQANGAFALASHLPSGSSNVTVSYDDLAVTRITP